MARLVTFSKGRIVLEIIDIYDANHHRTGKTCCRGDHRESGEYILVVCVWVYDGRGHLLMTRRAPEKSFAGTWENSGGVAQSGEDSLTAIRRELWEETGIDARLEDFEFLHTTRDSNALVDHYCLCKDTPLEQIKLLPGETDDVKWVSFSTVHSMIRQGEICQLIGEQFLLLENELLKRQTAQ